jgi:hypothetical protein
MHSHGDKLGRLKNISDKGRHYESACCNIYSERNDTQQRQINRLTSSCCGDINKLTSVRYYIGILSISQEEMWDYKTNSPSL